MMDHQEYDRFFGDLLEKRLKYLDEKKAFDAAVAQVNAKLDLEEYKRIQAKQSKLSANERRAVVARVEGRA